MDRTKLKRESNIVEKFSNLPPRWMEQHRVVRNNETNFPLALLSYSMMRTVGEGGHGRKEEWRKKKEERVGSSSAAERKIGNILRPSVRHRAGDELRLPVCVLFWENDYRSLPFIAQEVGIFWWEKKEEEEEEERRNIFEQRIVKWICHRHSALLKLFFVARLPLSTGYSVRYKILQLLVRVIICLSYH